MTEEMIELYKSLSTDDKNNELNMLIYKLNEIINQLLKQNNVDFEDLVNVNNYDSIKQKIDTEDDKLLYFFEELWNIKNKVLLMLLNNEISA